MNYFAFAAENARLEFGGGLCHQAGERPAKAEPQTVTICGWCPDAREKTAALVREGKRVSHGICPACQARIDTEMDEKEQK
jgi:hypothetical protein